MSWRKWLVRGLVFTVVAGLAGGGWVYQRWTSPTVVRQQVIDRLQALFPKASVSLESARLRLLGGIALSELRLARRDDPTRTDFAYVPAARIYYDKEQLLEGRLALRKVELYRPRLRLVREKDGRWSWADLLGPSDPKALLPTLVIDDGTLLLEDRVGSAGQPPLEITNVHLTLVNDPLATVTIIGAGRSAMLGNVDLRVTWRRDAHQTAVVVQAVGVPVTPSLVERLAGDGAQGELSGLSVEGTADLKAVVDLQPAGPHPLKYDVSCHVKQGKVQHPRLPIPLSQLELEAHCKDGQLTLDRLSASAGSAKVTATATAMLPSPAQTFKAAVSVNHLPVTRELCQRLPWNMDKVYDALRPRGPLSISLECQRDGGAWQRRHCKIQPEGTAVCYDKFTYPVEQVTGTLDLDGGTGLLHINLAGRAGTQPVFLKGTWQGLGKAANVAMTLQADGVPVDERLFKALPEQHQGLARSFHPSGLVDIRAQIRHVPGAETFANTYTARFRDATLKWNGFPYHLAKVAGTFMIFPDHWEFRDFTGIHKEAEVQVSGQSFPRDSAGPPGGEAHVVIDLVGRNVGIDADLREALSPMPGLFRAWDSFRPEGRLSFRAKVDRLPGKPQDIDIGVNVSGCAIKPVFFGYRLEDLSGHFHYKSQCLHVTQVQASHGDSRVSIDQGQVLVSPRGAFYAVLEDLWANPVVPDQEFVAALPRNLAAGVSAVKLQDPFKLWAKKVIVSLDEAPGSRPVVWWDGLIRLDRARLSLGIELSNVTGTLACIGGHDGRQMYGLDGNAELTQATVLKQPFENVYSHFHIDGKAPSVLQINLSKAPLYGGELSGQARLELGSPLRYDVNLTASQIDMRQLGRQNLGPKTELAGLGWGRLYLTGQGAGIDTLDGNGSFHVPRGKLYDLPFLLDLIKFLGLRWPDRTFFEEAHADFSIHGRRLNIDRLDLWGHVLSLSGKGGLNLDGTETALDFYPSWGRVEQLLPPAVRTVPPALSKNLLKIEVRGRVGGSPEELHFHKMPIPVLVDPILQLRDRVVGEAGK
jgi:hypothetical protein